MLIILIVLNLVLISANSIYATTEHQTGNIINSNEIQGNNTNITNTTNLNTTNSSDKTINIQNSTKSTCGELNVVISAIDQIKDTTTRVRDLVESHYKNFTKAAGDESNTKNIQNSTKSIKEEPSTINSSNNPAKIQYNKAYSGEPSAKNIQNSTEAAGDESNTKNIQNPTKSAGESSAATFTINQIKDATARVQAFVESNCRLPDYVTISNTQITMPQFLELLTTSLLNIKNKKNNPITLKSFNAPTNPKGNMHAGKIPKSEYSSIAQRIKSFMDSNGRAPKYVTSSLGTIQYESLVYMYSKILNFHNKSNKLPNYVTISPWKSVSTPPNLKPYLLTTTNCQSDNQRIKSLASSITNGVSSTQGKATKIFNWVRDNIGYSFYNNTHKGAVGTLNAKTGNCCDTSHLLIALARAAGIPSRYVHGKCKFSSGKWYGHVWAQLYVNGKWIIADAISSRNSFGVINNWNRVTAIIKGYYRELPF